jgi:hypothetical protein
MPTAVLAANCGGTNQLNNPVGCTTITQYVEMALRAFVLIAIPILAFLIVLAGFNFVFARGNPEKLALAKWNFLYVIIGTVLILGAWVFANLIGATITSISS